MKNSTVSPCRFIHGILAVIVAICWLQMLSSPVYAWDMGEPIVTYWGDTGLTTPVAQQMAAGGWNLVNAQWTPWLDVAKSQGLRAMWVGDLSDATINTIKNHPALYGYLVKDEPSVSEFSALAQQVAHIRELDPDHLIYINLFPNCSGTGVSDYRSYLTQYINAVKPDVLSYDYYQFKTTEDLSDYLWHLAVVSDVAKQAGIPFMNIVQTCSFSSEMRVPNANELRYLYNTTLAYGAQGISNYVYNHPSLAGGMMTNAGETTALYDEAKVDNPKFVAVAKQLGQLNRVGTYVDGYKTTSEWSWSEWKYIDVYQGPPGVEDMPGNSPFTVSGVSDISYSDGDPIKGILLSLFDADGAALSDSTIAFVVNLDYSNAITTRVTGPEELSIFDPLIGRWISQGQAWIDVTIAPGDSILVGLTSVVPEPAIMGLIFVGFTCTILKRGKTR